MSLYASFQKVIASLGMTELTHPIFYHSPIGIRFDIGENGNEVYIDKLNDAFSVNPDYVNACLDRSTKIYGSLKTAPDLLAIESYLCKEETIEGFISSVVSAADLPQPHEIKSEICHGEEDLVHVYLFWKRNGFQSDKVLEEIIRADLGSGNNFLTSSVHFVCVKVHVLFHLYDDRGADLVADKKETIQHIYRSFHDWISDFDRDKIERIFNTTAE